MAKDFQYIDFLIMTPMGYYSIYNNNPKESAQATLRSIKRNLYQGAYKQKATK